MADQTAPGPVSRRFNWRLWERFVNRPSVNGYSRQVGMEELSDAARAAVEEQLVAGERPSQIIFAPFQTVLGSGPGTWARGIRYLPWEYTRDRVIVLTGERLLALDLDEDGRLLEAAAAPLSQMLYLQSGKILLFSWLEWAWAQEGQVGRMRCYFNTVCERIYLQLAETVRCALAAPETLRPIAAEQNRRALAGMPFKFRNMLPLYLLPGEHIEQVVYRPALWEKRVQLWKAQTLARAALALTGTHLLLAEEDLTQSEEAYGLIVTFIPRGHITGARVGVNAGQASLAVQVSRGDATEVIAVPFQEAMQPEIEMLAEKISG